MSCASRSRLRPRFQSDACVRAPAQLAGRLRPGSNSTPGLPVSGRVKLKALQAMSTWSRGRLRRWRSASRFVLRLPAPGAGFFVKVGHRLRLFFWLQALISAFRERVIIRLVMSFSTSDPKTRGFSDSGQCSRNNLSGALQDCGRISGRPYNRPKIT